MNTRACMSGRSVRGLGSAGRRCQCVRLSFHRVRHSFQDMIGKFFGVGGKSLTRFAGSVRR